MPEERGGGIKRGKIAVTAPTSVVAGNYIKHIESRYDVVTIGRRNSDIIFDFSKDDELEIAGDVDAVIHFAGALHASCAKDVYGMINTNVCGIIKVCDVAKRHGAKQGVHIFGCRNRCRERTPFCQSIRLAELRVLEEAVRVQQPMSLS